MTALFEGDRDAFAYRGLVVSEALGPVRVLGVEREQCGGIDGLDHVGGVFLCHVAGGVPLPHIKGEVVQPVVDAFLVKLQFFRQRFGPRPEEGARNPFQQTSGIGNQQEWLKDCVENNTAVMPYDLLGKGQRTLRDYL